MASTMEMAHTIPKRMTCQAITLPSRKPTAFKIAISFFSSEIKLLSIKIVTRTITISVMPRSSISRLCTVSKDFMESMQYSLWSMILSLS